MAMHVIMSTQPIRYSMEFSSQETGLDVIIIHKERKNQMQINGFEDESARRHVLEIRSGTPFLGSLNPGHISGWPTARPLD
jgi:hypothetical protein